MKVRTLKIDGRDTLIIQHDTHRIEVPYNSSDDLWEIITSYFKDYCPNEEAILEVME